MYDGRDKNTNSQTNDSIKYISNIHEGVMQNEIYKFSKKMKSIATR